MSESIETHDSCEPLKVENGGVKKGACCTVGVFISILRVARDDNGILRRTNAFHMCPHPCNDRSKISKFTCPMRDFT